MLTFSRRLTRFTNHCPPPLYDTGCTFCVPEFPPGKSINTAQNLLGTAAVPWKHVLVLSHGFDFNSMPSKIEFAPNSAAAEFQRFKHLLSPTHRPTLSNALFDGMQQSTKHLVRVYPDCKTVEFENEQMEQFVEHYLLPESTLEVYNPFAKTSGGRARVDHTGQFEEGQIDKDLVLICAHTQRDVRCGLVAPLLKNEFEEVFKREGLNVDVGYISHIGGHAYAGNVLYFPKNGLEPVWYGRVMPDRVQGIVKETIVGGRIIEELYRGSKL